MEVDVSVSVKGADQVVRNAGKAAFRLSTASRLTASDTAYAIRDGSKQTVPVDTGALKRSIRVEKPTSLDRNVFILQVVYGGKERNPTTGQIVNYAAHVEFGTSKQAPQPYARPVRDREFRRIPARLKERIGTHL